MTTLPPLRNTQTEELETQTLEPALEPDVVPERDDGTGGEGFRVILYNDEWHGMDEVVEQIQKATGCSPERAISIMVEAHVKGRAVCFKGARLRCQRVAGVLREIRLQCEVDSD